MQPVITDHSEAPHRETHHGSSARFVTFPGNRAVAVPHIALPEILAVPLLPDALGESRETFVKTSVQLDGAGLVVQLFEFLQDGRGQFFDCQLRVHEKTSFE